MSLESQLKFDISRCSHCSLGKSRKFCAPIFNPHCDTILLFASPDANACREHSPWEHSALKYLKKLLLHAHGTDLSRFHISFLSKCHVSYDETPPSLSQRREWAETCSKHYLDYEIKAVGAKQILCFGETVTRLCFPNHQLSFPLKEEVTLNLQPYEIPAHLFENPLSLPSKGGIRSPEGLKWVKRLHKLLGGSYSPPQSKESQALFDLL